MPKHRGGRRSGSGDPPWSKRGTSREAALSVASITAKQRREVFNCIKQAGADGCTREEVQKLLDLAPNSVTPRFWELEGDGMIKRNGRYRPNDSGKRAEVYVVADTPPEHNSLGVRL